MQRSRRHLAVVRSSVLLTACVLLWRCGGGGGQTNPPVPPVPVATPSPSALPLARAVGADPFSDPGGQHATVVEPSAFAFGSTIVAAFQTGRSPGFGASDIGFATSADGGGTWLSATLPATTRVVSPLAQFDTVSDPVVAYDAAHRTWLISSAPVSFASGVTPSPLVSRSLDGVRWSDPVSVTPAQNLVDKPWTACDNTPSSAFYGHCYIVWDEAGLNGLLHVSVSTDGGATWSPAHNTRNGATGIGAQPVIEPNGTVIVPSGDFDLRTIFAFSSVDGGATWSGTTAVSDILAHREAVMRSPPFPTAQRDAAGRVYLLWQDCRYRANCGANDLVLSTSDDGVRWTSPARVPIDPLASTVDHFIPGLAVDAMTSGAGTVVGVTYYTYSDTACSADLCRLFASFIGSRDGGSTWTAPVTLAGPMQTAWLATTRDGPMVGDYIATVFVVHTPLAVFVAANPSVGGKFDEALYVSLPGALTVQSSARRTPAGERPIPAVRSDRPRRPGP